MPIADLSTADFQVRVDGDARRVVSAEWVPLDTPATASAAAAPPPPAGYSSNDNATGGRLILIVVDELNIRAGGTLGIRKAMNDFIDGLQPSDRAAIVGIGQGAPSTPFTADRQMLKKAIERLVGQHHPSAMSQFNISVSEALDIRNGATGDARRRDRPRVRRVFASPIFPPVPRTSRWTPRRIAQTGLFDGEQTVSALRALFVALRRIDAPKTVLFVSEGFLVGDQRAAVAELGALAGAARTSVYSLKLDDSLFTISADERRSRRRRFRIEPCAPKGSKCWPLASRGSLYNVIGSGAGVFDAAHVGAVRLLPARHRIGGVGQGRQVASGARRSQRAAARRCGRAARC